MLKKGRILWFEPQLNGQELCASGEGAGGSSGEGTKGGTGGDCCVSGGGGGGGDGNAARGDDAAAGSAGARAQSTVATPTATAATAAAEAAEASSTSGKAKAAKAAPKEARRRSRTKTTTTAEQPSLWLEAVAGCLKGQVWPVETCGATLGRASDNKLSLADKEMSRRHSKVWMCHSLYCVQIDFFSEAHVWAGEGGRGFCLLAAAAAASPDLGASETTTAGDVQRCHRI